MAQKITPFLWFNGRAAEAARFYTKIFKNSKILDINPMSSSFRIEGMTFMGLNGGPLYKFTPAISFYVSCKTQKEVDYYWKKLLAGGGKPSRCGWLKDRFGVSWQIIPDCLGDYLGASDRAKADRALTAMLKMKKLDIAKLKKAFDGK